MKPFQWRGHLGWQKVQTPEVLPELVLPEGRLKNGGASGQEVADLEKKKPLYIEKPSDPMEYVAIVQGSPASKHLVGLPEESQAKYCPLQGRGSDG